MLSFRLTDSMYSIPLQATFSQYTAFLIDIVSQLMTRKKEKQ